MSKILRKGLEKLSSLLDTELNYSHAKHNFELGLPLESSLRHFFRAYFPSRYGFTSGYIVDKEDTISNQIDWIIFDSDNFAPLLANIHSTEGPEWLPFDAVYGCVEVKRTLTEEALETAFEQIKQTKRLNRDKTNLLCIAPYVNVPRDMYNINPSATFDEICNSLYAGIYAFLPGVFLDSEVLFAKMEELSRNVDPLMLPDFIAVHGAYYVRRARYNKTDDKIDIPPFIEQCNAYVTIRSDLMTSGVFYVDLLTQFANTLLSARSNTLMLGNFLGSSGLMQVTGKVVFP